MSWRKRTYHKEIQKCQWCGRTTTAYVQDRPTSETAKPDRLAGSAMGFCPKCGVKLENSYVIYPEFQCPLYAEWGIDRIHRATCNACGETFLYPLKFVEEEVSNNCYGGCPTAEPLMFHCSSPTPDRLAQFRQKYRIPDCLRTGEPKPGQVYECSAEIADIRELLDMVEQDPLRDQVVLLSELNRVLQDTNRKLEAMLEATHPTALSVEVDRVRAEKAEVERCNEQLYNDFSEGRDEIGKLRRENEIDHKLLIRVRDLWPHRHRAGNGGLRGRLYVEIMERVADDPQT